MCNILHFKINLFYIEKNDEFYKIEKKSQRMESFGITAFRSMTMIPSLITYPSASRFPSSTLSLLIICESYFIYKKLKLLKLKSI